MAARETGDGPPGRGVRRHAAPAVLAGIGTAALLRRMQAELLTRGRLRPATMAWMYAAYGTHAAASFRALVRRGQLRLPRTVAWCGGATALGGTAVLVAGMSRFAGPGQISAAEVGAQLTGGVYRYSRNPQYTGYLLQLAGLALARRSATALALTGALAAVYRWWVRIEEAHLATEFGQNYHSYRDRTPRWFGLPRRRAAA